jgi:hypothetical protein
MATDAQKIEEMRALAMRIDESMEMASLEFECNPGAFGSWTCEPGDGTRYALMAVGPIGAVGMADFGSVDCGYLVAVGLSRRACLLSADGGYLDIGYVEEKFGPLDPQAARVFTAMIGIVIRRKTWATKLLEEA